MNTSRLVELFRRFNRKERYWLVRHALGQTSASLGSDFRYALQEALKRGGKAVVIPDDADWAIDYHIDWLTAVLRFHDSGTSNTENAAFANDSKEIEGNQQDFDLVVAFDNCLILVEVKGVGSWSNKQLSSKIKRLRSLRSASKLIGSDGRTKSGVQLYFVLCSPLRSERISELQEWPSWTRGADGEPIWMCLRPPDNRTDFQAITRFENDSKWKAVGQTVRVDCN